MLYCLLSLSKQNYSNFCTVDAGNLAKQVLRNIQ